MKQLRLVFAGTLIWTLMFTGCKASDKADLETSITPTITPISTSTDIQTEYTKIMPNDALAMMSEEVIILDVRTQAEYDEGHIPNAILLPDNEIQNKAESILTDKKQTILVYCRSGNRSKSASKELIGLGYEKVYDFGGIIDWTGEIIGQGLYPSYYSKVLVNCKMIITEDYFENI